MLQAVLVKMFQIAFANKSLQLSALIIGTVIIVIGSYLIFRINKLAKVNHQLNTLYILMEKIDYVTKVFPKFLFHYQIS